MYILLFWKKKNGGRGKDVALGGNGGGVPRSLLPGLRLPSVSLWGSKPYTPSKLIFFLTVPSITLDPGVQTRLCPHVASDLGEVSSKNAAMANQEDAWP